MEFKAIRNRPIFVSTSIGSDPNPRQLTRKTVFFLLGPMKFKDSWCIHLLLAVFFWQVGLWGNPSEPCIQKLKFETVSERLNVPESLYLAMLQDRQGMIWMLSKEALIRFDGDSFKVHPTGIVEYTSQIDQYRQSLFIDGQDNIWVGRGAVVSRLVKKTGRFKHYYLDHNEGITGIPGIAQDKDGVLYCLSSNGRLYRLNETNDTFEAVLIPDGYMNCYSFCIDSENRFWVGGRAAFFRYQIEEQLVEKIDLQQSGQAIFNSRVYTIQPYRDNRLLIGTQEDGLVILDPEKGSFEHYSLGGWIYKIVVDQWDNIYMGSTLGLTVISADTGQWYPYFHNPDNHDSIPPGTVWSILPDREGNIWATSSISGLLVAYANIGFDNLQYKADWIPLVPTKNNVSSVYEDREGNLWLGYHNTGLERLNYAKQTSWFGEGGGSQPDQIGQGSVLALQEDRQGHMWVGCSTSGLTIIDPHNGKSCVVPGDPNSPESPGATDLRDMSYDRQGKLWLMFHEGAVDHYDPETGHFDHLISLERPLEVEGELWLFDILIDAQDKVWLCSSLGLWILNEEGGVDRESMGRWIDHTPLDHLQINCIWEDQPGCYWIGTIRGLFYLDTQKPAFFHYTIHDGLPSDQISSINGINDGTVWVATENGISHFDPKVREFVNYHANDGLPTNGYYIGSTFRSRDNTLYFGGKHGVVKFRPEDIRRSDPNVPVLISGFKLYNREVRVGAPDEPGAILRSPIETTEKITLPYEPYTVTFEFVALSFRNSFENTFSYKLDGFDDEWSALDKRRDCTYTNLNPGHYVFRVRAKNYEGQWIDSEANLELVILPPFWKTLWFRVLTAVLIIFIGGSAYYLRVRFINKKRWSLQRLVDTQTRQLRDAMHELEVQKIQIADQNTRLMEQHHNLEERIRERTEELEISKLKAEESDRIKSAFLENISHEFRTPMNAILGGVTILCENDIKEQDRQYYASVITQNSDSLLKLIDDILDLSRMEAGELPISVAPVDIDFFCEQLYSQYSEYLMIQEKDAVELILDKQPGYSANSDLFFTDKKRLSQAFSHLIENAIKFTSRGSVKFGYRFVEYSDVTHIQFFVEDTGIGIPADQIEHVFDQFTKFYNRKGSLHSGTGLGLSIVKKLTESMGGTIRVDSVSGEGTIMVLEFPYVDEMEWE